MRHCEESDDEAIQKPWIAALPLDGLVVARNDTCGESHRKHAIQKTTKTGAARAQKGETTIQST